MSKKCRLARLNMSIPEEMKADLQKVAEKYNTDMTTMLKLILKYVIPQL